MQNLSGKSADLFIQDNLCVVLVLAALHIFCLSFFKGSAFPFLEIKCVFNHSAHNGHKVIRKKTDSVETKMYECIV